MSLNRYSVETPEVAFLKKDLDGLNDVYRDIADEIGVENALAIYRRNANFISKQVVFKGIHTQGHYQ